MNIRFENQIQFLIEIDKIKSIFRKNKLFDKSRHENDAEHSWHISMMAIVLSEYANSPIDLPKVIKMLLIHDIVEIDTGDTIVYKIDHKEKAKKESAAAKRIFGILPDDQRDEFIGLWREFEETSTTEARFATAVDRLEPVMQNALTGANVWIEHQINAHQILDVNKRIGEGSDKLWEYAKRIIEECMDRGEIH
jgi:putative hydrolases of HD superfamily